MPPFVSTNCPNCQHKNQFDLAELRKTDTMLLKNLLLQDPLENEEFSVTCQHCGRKFKLILKGGKNDEEK